MHDVVSTLTYCYGGAITTEIGQDLTALQSNRDHRKFLRFSGPQCS